MGADVIVLGAGPAGIGAALALGQSALVLESQPDVAGLSQTIVYDDVIFDLGGHSFHTPHAEVRELVFRALPMEEQVRDAWVWMEGEWLRYPFQKHFGSLKCEQTRFACESGLQAAGDWERAVNFDEYISKRFGAGIATHFMRPYNRKLWGRDLARMAADWVNERVAAPHATAPQRMEMAAGKRQPLQDNTMIAYPATGGFGEIFKALARKIRSFKVGQTVTGIDPVRQTLTVAGGERFTWSRIVSTLSLPRLLGLLPAVPAEITASVASLEALPIRLVLLTFERPISQLRQRIYNPGAIPGHKIVFNNTSSQWLRAQPRHGIQVEVSETGEGSDSRTDSQTLIVRTIEGLIQMGQITPDNPVHAAKVVRLPLGYPVPTHERTRIVEQARRWLATQQIYIAGRFAEWSYINSDEALHRGLSLGRQLSGADARIA
jgi:protoporphyrinogen oxidase